LRLYSHDGFQKVIFTARKILFPSLQRSDSKIPNGLLITKALSVYYLIFISLLTVEFLSCLWFILP